MLLHGAQTVGTVSQNELALVPSRRWSFLSTVSAQQGGFRPANHSNEETEDDHNEGNGGVLRTGTNRTHEDRPDTRDERPPDSTNDNGALVTRTPLRRSRSISYFVYRAFKAAKLRVLRMAKPRRHTVGPVISTERANSSDRVGRKKSILGCPLLPDTLVDTAHLSILNAPSKTSGFITDITLRLGGKPPGNGRDWEVRIYEKKNENSFEFVNSENVTLNIDSFEEQRVTLNKPLKIAEDQYVGLLNRSGRLSLTYNRGWMLQNSPEGLHWDLWYTEYTPPAELGSTTGSLLMWSGKVGWYATMEENPPPPEVKVKKSSLVFDLQSMLQDDCTKDFTFLIKYKDDPFSTELKVHKAMLIARSEYWRAFFTSDFRESEAQLTSVEVNHFPPYAFSKLIQYIYTDDYDLSGIDTGKIELLAEIARMANHYCMERLLSLTEKKMIACLTADNIVHAYEIAKLLQTEQLKSYCFFFCLRYETDIVDTINSSNVVALIELGTESLAKNLVSCCKDFQRFNPPTASSISSPIEGTNS